MGKATLSWDHNTEADLKEYRVYRGVNGAPLVFLVSVPKGTNTYVDNNLTDGSYTYNLTAVDISNNESTHSASKGISIDSVPPQAPVGLVVVAG